MSSLSTTKAFAGSNPLVLKNQNHHRSTLSSMPTTQTPNQSLMNQLQIKTQITDIEAKTDKNSHPYFRLSLVGLPSRYFYVFGFGLPPETFDSLTNVPHNFINRLVLISYQELPNKTNSGTFFKVSGIELI